MHYLDHSHVALPHAEVLAGDDPDGDAAVGAVPVLLVVRQAAALGLEPGLERVGLAVGRQPGAGPDSREIFDPWKS